MKLKGIRLEDWLERRVDMMYQNISKGVLKLCGIHWQRLFHYLTTQTSNPTFAVLDYSAQCMTVSCRQVIPAFVTNAWLWRNQTFDSFMKSWVQPTSKAQTANTGHQEYVVKLVLQMLKWPMWLETSNMLLTFIPSTYLSQGTLPTTNLPPLQRFQRSSLMYQNQPRWNWNENGYGEWG